MNRPLRAMLLVLAAPAVPTAPRSIVTVDESRARTPPLYGWSSEITITDVHDMQLAATTALTSASVARYPGGTPADYMDWRTGWHWPSMTWSPHDGPWYDVPVRNATPAGWRKWSEAADIPFTCIDVCQLCNNTEQCCTLELELAGLHEHERVGNDVTHVELGNEMYDTSRADVMREYPQPSDYSDKMLGWVKAIKKDFPTAQVALVGMQANGATWPQEARPGTHATQPPDCAGNMSAACRMTNWNREVLMESEAGKAADAATIHVYFSEYQNYNATQMLADPTSFEHFIGRAFTAAFDNAEWTALSVPLHLRIWVTEAGLFGSRPTARTWVDALTVVALDCLLALSNRTDLILIYGLNEGQDPAVESPVYPCVGWAKEPCAPPSAANNAAFRVTTAGAAQGMLYAAARRAAAGTMAPLLFSSNPQLSPAENRSSVLVGFRFDSEDGGAEALILNLGNATIMLDVKAVFPSGHTTLHVTRLYSKTRADAVVAGLNSSQLGRDVLTTSASGVSMRPFSVTSLRAAKTDDAAVAFGLNFGRPTLVGSSGSNQGSNGPNQGSSGSNQSCVTSGGPTPQHPSIPWGPVPCHCWFPTYGFQLGIGPGAVHVVGIMHQGDPGGPNPAPRVLYASVDGGRTYTQAAVPGVASPFLVLLPEAPWFKHRADSSERFSTLAGFGCEGTNCSGTTTGWHATVDAAKLPAVTLQPEPARQLIIRGAPSKMVKAWIALPVMLQDGSLLAVTNGLASDAMKTCSSCTNPTCKADGVENRGNCSNLFFFACPDPVNAPTEWVYRSRIDYVPAMSGYTWPGYTVGGLGEPDLVQLADGRVLTVFRLDANTGHWAALSGDGGKSWGEPFPTGTWAVAPALVAFASGAVVLSSGRPALGLWVTSFANQTRPKWRFYSVAAAHNAAVSDPAYRFPAADVAVHDVHQPGSAGPQHARYNRSTTAYTSLFAVDEQTLRFTYDRLAHGWKGPPGPEGPPGPLGMHDRVFTVVVKLTAE